MNSKKYLDVLLLIFIYLVLLFGFAGVFVKCANLSSGEDFIFREDLLLPIQIDEISRQLDIDRTDESIRHEIKDLLLKDKRVHSELLLDLSDEWYEGYEPLGYVWADFYRAFYRSRGATHCVIEYHDGPLNPWGTYPPHYKDVSIRICAKVEWGTLLDMDYDFPVVRFSLVENALKEISTAELTVDWSLYSLHKPEDEIKKLTSGNAYVVPIAFDYFHDLISSSHWTPDKNVLKVFSEVYNRRDYSYRYWDFFYFSAVALTTIGYGDILPNSTTVRVLVAIEAILGVAVITAIIGMILSPRRNRNKRRANKT